MNMQELNSDKAIQRVSPIYEKVFSPEGNGFSGFTVYYAEDAFKNHIQFFEKNNHSQVMEQMETLRAIYCHTCQSEDNDEIKQDNKEKNL